MTLRRIAWTLAFFCGFACAGARADILLAGVPDPDEPDFELWLAADGGTFEDALGSDPAEAGDEILVWANQANSTTPDALGGLVNAAPRLAVADWDGQSVTVLEFLGDETLVVDDDLDQLDPGTGGFTIIAVARQTWPDSNATDYWLGKGNFSGNSAGYSVASGQGDELRVRVGSGSSAELAKGAQTHPPILDRPIVVSMVMTGSEVFGFVDGSPSGWSDGGDDAEAVFEPLDNDYTGSVDAATGLIVGGRGSTSQNQEFTGDFAELLIYSRELSVADRQAVEGYLAGKYGIELAGSLVSSGDTWLYLDDGSDPGPTWTDPGFTDGTWSTGASPLGYGNGDEATVVASGPAGDHHITTYFRHHFNVANPASVGALTLYLRRDDGAAAYLNGVEVLHTNLPDVAGSETPATSTTHGSAERHYVGAPVDPDLLVVGDNVLAVEVHLDGATSPDLSFDLELDTGPDPGHPALQRTPYLQVGTPSSMVVRWQTDVPSSGRLRWGPAPGNLPNELTTALFRNDHEFQVTGLEPATKYFYSVGSTSLTLAGDDADHFFTTSPVSGATDPVRIWALGDSGDCGRIEEGCIDAAKVRDAYLSFAAGNPAELVLMLGDNAYSNGTPAEYDVGVWDSFGTVLRSAVLWPAPGNHEFGASDSATQTGPYYQTFTMPTAGEAGGVASGTEAYYSYDHGNVHLVALDSHDTDRSAPANPTS
ncbi:MAG: purple acid phosphatase family protein, partial [Myxococcota bacterium]